MANRDIVAIGASAGGVEALRYLAGKFPSHFPASVLITLHLPSHYNSSLDTILGQAGPLSASFAADHELLRKGHIHLAPPGCHLLVEGDKIILGNGPRENNARPAIDPMLRSVALCCGGRSVGVILTGTQGDGASGLWALREAGGFAVVQDPKDALFSEMPERALKLAQPNYISTLSELPELMVKLVDSLAQPTLPLPERIRFDVEVAKNGHHGMSKMDKVGVRSTLTCPDCGHHVGN